MSINKVLASITVLLFAVSFNLLAQSDHTDLEIQKKKQHEKASKDNKGLQDSNFNVEIPSPVDHSAEGETTSKLYSQRNSNAHEPDLKDFDPFSNRPGSSCRPDDPSCKTIFIPKSPLEKSLKSALDNSSEVEIIISDPNNSKNFLLCCYAGDADTDRKGLFEIKLMGRDLLCYINEAASKTNDARDPYDPHTPKGVNNF